MTYQKSILNRLSAQLLAVSILLALASAVGAYAFLYSTYKKMHLSEVKRYIDSRAAQKQVVFDNLRALEAQATSDLLERYENIEIKDHLDEFDDLFPLQKDGTRRSNPKLFDGIIQGNGERVYGIGAFIAAGDSLSLEDKKLLLAAYQVVRDFGLVMHAGFDNFWFFTTSNQLIIFAPERPDRLRYYRTDAASSFEFQSEEFVENTLPANNPNRELLCTGLRQIMYDKTGATKTSGCQTPVDINGQHVGGFGVSLLLDGWLQDAVKPGIENVIPILLDRNGKILSYHNTPDNEAAKFDHPLLLRELAEVDITNPALANQFSTNWLSQHYLIFTKIDGPDWILAMAVPKRHIKMKAAIIAGLALLFLLFALTSIIVTVYFCLKQSIIRPLRSLTQKASVPSTDQFSGINALINRDDEFGSLATALYERDTRLHMLVTQLEDNVRVRTRELNIAKEQAEHASHAKTEFLTNLSHEIRTPMTGMTGVLTVLERTTLNKTQKNLLSVLQSSSENILSIINSTLDISQIDAGNIVIDPKPFSLVQLLTDLESLYKPMARQKGLRLSISTAPHTPEFFKADLTRLKQILANLISNAIKFTAEGFVCIHAKHINGNSLEFRIIDSGPGIDDTLKEDVFDRFYQGKLTATNNIAGSGLGLSISQKLAHLLGGKIQLDSKPDQGATFIVTVEAKPIEEEFASSLPVPASPEFDTSMKGKKILLVEDNAINRRVIQWLCKPYGFKVIEVDNGMDAIKVWRKTKFDAILMDINMPQMCGLMTTRLIRKEEQQQGLPRTPIIATTGLAFENQVQEQLAAGVDAHLAKPVKVDDLISTLSELSHRDQAA